MTIPDKRHYLMFLYRIFQNFSGGDIELVAIATGERQRQWRGILDFFGRFHAAKNPFSRNRFCSIDKT